MAELSQGKAVKKVNCRDTEVLSSFLIPRSREENFHSKKPIKIKSSASATCAAALGCRVRM